MSLPLLPVFKERNPLVGGDPLTLPVRPDAWEVGRLSWDAVGGPKSATITTSGAPTALAQLLDLLRCPIEIYDSVADLVWWGLVWEVKIQIGDITIGASLDKLANKVRTVYTLQNSGVSTAGARGTTDWAQDADSVAEYGARELSISQADVTPEQAEQARDAHLAKYKLPRATRQIGGRGRKQQSQAQAQLEEEEVVAQVTILGENWWRTLEWTYYGQNPGTTSSENEPTTISKIGRAPYVGGAGNITFADVGGVWQINDSANGLGNWEAGDYLVISGTTLNDIKTRVLSVADDGSQLIVSDQMDNEAPAGAVTLTPWSTKVAQSFQLDDYGETYYVHTVRLQAQLVGLPAVGSKLRVSIAQDNTGEPGAVLAYADLPWDADGDGTEDEILETMLWLDWRDWDTIITLSPLTTYWLIVERTDADAANCYQVALDEAAEYLGGEALFWTGATWEVFQNSDAVARPADLPFVVLGAWTPEKMLEEMIAASAFITSVEVEDASGSYGFPFRNGDSTLLQEVKTVLKSGVSGGRRYLAEVQSDRSLKIYEEPESAGDKDLQLTTGGRYLDHKGQEIKPYKLQSVVAHWVQLPPAILTVLNAANLTLQSPFLVESAEWTPGGGLRVGEDPWGGEGIREG